MYAERVLIDLSAHRVRIEAEHLGALSDRDLKARVVCLVAQRARIEAEYLAMLGELASRNGVQGAAHVLREETRMNSPQARSEARLAESLVEHDMADTLDALACGEIQLSHARVIAREAPKEHRRSEAEFLELCRAYPSDTVARHSLAYQSQQVYADLAAEAAAEGRTPDSVDAEYALQLGERYGSLRLGDDGMWHLRAKLDMIAGRQFSYALQAAVRSLRRRHDDSHGSDGSEVPTRGQLTADALCELVLGGTPARRVGTSLVIVADYDMVNDRLANPRLDDGTPLSAQLLVEHAVDATPPTQNQTRTHQTAQSSTSRPHSAWNRSPLGTAHLGSLEAVGRGLTPESTESRQP